MHLTTDHYFSIGEQHLRLGKPCQDYALSGNFEKMAYAIVSDGCSSGAHTDIGARFTALAAALAIKNQWAKTKQIFFGNAAGEIDIQQNIILHGTYHMLGLRPEDMLATSLWACASQEGVLFHALGDGVMAWKSKNGSIIMEKLEWALNAPLYPIYGEDNFQTFIEFHGGNANLHALTSEKWKYAPTSGYEPLGKNEFSIAEGIQGISKVFGKAKIDAEEIEFIAIFSDGVAQIENMDWKEVVLELLSFKNTAGSFVKRRTISFLKKDGKAIDDLACAVIRIEKNRAQEDICQEHD